MANNLHIIINTNQGEIKVALFSDQAPITVANFLTYISEKRFDASGFFRIVTQHNANQPEDKNTQIQVIQGGLAPGDKRLLSGIEHESTQSSGISHTHGTISMARFEPGTADGSFFFCIGDQPELDFGGKRYDDGLGFAAFGRIVNGFDVLEKIYQLAQPQEYLDPPIKIHHIRLA